MTKYAAIDVSMEQTAICVVEEDGRKIAEGEVPTDPDAITDWLAGKAGQVARIGMETGPLAVWLWNELDDPWLADRMFGRPPRQCRSVHDAEQDRSARCGRTCPDRPDRLVQASPCQEPRRGARRSGRCPRSDRERSPRAAQNLRYHVSKVGGWLYPPRRGDRLGRTRGRAELCGNLGDEVDQAALCGFISMTSIPSWNLTPASSFGN